MTSLVYRVSPHLPGAAFNCVGFSTDALEIGGCQRFAHQLNSSSGVCAKSVDQADYQTIVFFARCFQ